MNKHPLRRTATFSTIILAIGALAISQTTLSAPMARAAQSSKFVSASSTSLLSSLFHDSYQSLYRSPFGADPTDSPVTLRLLGPTDMTSAQIQLQNINNNIKHSAQITMHRITGHQLIQLVGAAKAKTSSLWEGTIPAKYLKVPGILSYNFYAHEGKQAAYYGDNGNGYGGVGMAAASSYMIVPYHITVYDNTFTTPNWLVHGLIYEIFPDRFYNGNKANDENPLTQKAIGTLPNGSEGLVPVQFHQNWNSLPYDPNIVPNPLSSNYKKELAARGNGTWSTDFFGGDLQGIIDKLHYLQQLGVNTLYLTPIFQAESNHKYDTGNFYQIDPGFGTLQTYKNLIAASKKLGMHVILDGVFEDTGSDSLYFNRFGNYNSVGAYQQFTSGGKVKSPYYSLYQWTPTGYVGWSGIDTLPQTNTAGSAWQQFVYGKWDPKDPTNPAKNSVARYWLSLGASGWRLDSANNNNYSIAWWTAFRKAVKQVNPNAAIIGEDWNDPTNDNGVDWLTGTTWDSTMNYPFRNDVISFFRGSYNDGNVQNYAMDASQLGSTLMQMLEEYPKPAMYAEMNLLDSHDTERILTILEGAPDASNTTANQQAFWQPTTAQKAAGIQKFKLVADFQYGFVGVPMIYYGDEAGMIGYKDPLDRGTYPWGNVDQSLINYFIKLGQIRNSHPVLQSGNYQQLYAKGNTIAFARTIRNGRDALGDKAANATAIVAINNGAKESLTINVSTILRNGTKVYDALNGNRAYVVKNGTINLALPTETGAMLFTK